MSRFLKIGVPTANNWSVSDIRIDFLELCIFKKTSKFILMKPLIFGVLSSLLFSSCLAPKETPPNIVFIMSDDHAFQAVSAYGQGLNHTPNIDRIATGARQEASLEVWYRLWQQLRQQVASSTKALIPVQTRPVWDKKWRSWLSEQRWIRLGCGDWCV